MDVHIGTSGFSFPGWRAKVYPYALKPGEMFDYYCRNFGFDCVEINSSFYQMPMPKSMDSLARRSPEGFYFMVKVYQAFTHNLSEATPELFQRFHQGIAPIAEAGKLRGLLAQFPSTFLPTRKNVAWIRELNLELAPLPLFVEFRHRLWDHPKMPWFLKKQGIGYCIADLPEVPPLPALKPAVTNGIAYARLHGRNPEWHRPSTSRYDYQYGEGELNSIFHSIVNLQGAQEIFFFFNNCHGAAAVRSGQRLKELVRQANTSKLPGLTRA